MTLSCGPKRLCFTPLLPIAFIAALLVVSGCAEQQLRTADSDPLEETYQTQEFHAFFWGAVLSPQVAEADCEDGLNDVVVKDSFFHGLASVITLGIWMPSQVEYRCRAPAGDGSAFPEAPAQ